MLSSQILQISTSYFRKENQEIIQIQRRLKGFLGGTSGKEPACQCRRHKRCGFDPWIRKNPWRREWHPTPVFLPGELHGQRILAGYSPRGCKESDTTERLTLIYYPIPVLPLTGNAVRIQSALRSTQSGGPAWLSK